MSCRDPELGEMMGILDQGSIFAANPYGTQITNMNNRAYSLQNDYRALELGGGPQAAAYGLAKDALIDLCGDGTLIGGNPLLYQNSAIGQFNVYSNFMSGQLAVFPGVELGVALTGVEGAAVLGGMGLIHMMSMIKGNKSMTDSGCMAPSHPDDPCYPVGAIFGIIMGGLTALIQALYAALLGPIVELVAAIAAFIADMYAQIRAALTALIAAVLKAINLGLAKLLSVLIKDPCLNMVLHAIAVPAIVEKINDQL